MIVYIENLIGSTKQNLLSLISEFGKIAGYKVNIQKSKAFLNIKNELSETEIRKKIIFTIATRKIKYLGINNQGGKRLVLRKLQNTEYIKKDTNK